MYTPQFVFNGWVLKHDYVVGEFFGAYPMNSQINNQNELSLNFTLSPEWKKRGYKFENLGAVIFVQNYQRVRFCRVWR